MVLLRPLPHTVTDRGDDRQPRSPGRSDQWGRVARTRKLRSQRLSRARRATRSMGLPRYPNCGQDAATVETGPRRVPGPMPPMVRPQSTPCRLRFTLSQTRTISAKRAEVHPNLSRRPSPRGTAPSRWPVTCRRGHHGVQTRGARAADHGIRKERHARLRALSRSVGTADGMPAHGSVSVAGQLCCQSRRGLARVSAQAAH